MQRCPERFVLFRLHCRQVNEFFLFPEPEKLANASINEIAKCGLGYRTKYVKKAAIAVNKGMIDFPSLKKQDYQEARDSLCQVFGIGKKVADCILLFSLEKCLG